MIPKHYRIHVVLMVSVLVMLVYPMITAKPDKDKERLATEAANRFLQRIDAGEYGPGWDDAASLLKKRIPREQWVVNLAQSRERTGAPVERVKAKAIYSPMAQDSPEGEYIVITYKTAFARQNQLNETVTVMLDRDARWRIAGYFVQ
ncbi:MAG: DUF4019 domain-containing protein [Desulfuromonadales bacterium]|nr:DUF4019 domain-containing protein [Desulfuromonadales bacterium]